MPVGPPAGVTVSLLSQVSLDTVILPVAGDTGEVRSESPTDRPSLKVYEKAVMSEMAAAPRLPVSKVCVVMVPGRVSVRDPEGVTGWGSAVVYDVDTQSNVTTVSRFEAWTAGAARATAKAAAVAVLLRFIPAPS